MGARGGWGPMSERVHQTATGQSELPATPEPPRTVKHCWVTGRHGRLPGLLLEWRRVGDQYDGRVVHPVHEDGAWILVEEWLPAALLERA